MPLQSYYHCHTKLNIQSELKSNQYRRNTAFEQSLPVLIIPLIKKRAMTDDIKLDFFSSFFKAKRIYNYHNYYQYKRLVPFHPSQALIYKLNNNKRWYIYITPSSRKLEAKGGGNRKTMQILHSFFMELFFSSLFYQQMCLYIYICIYQREQGE